jgi:hypothetical protein
VSTEKSSSLSKIFVSAVESLLRVKLYSSTLVSAATRVCMEVGWVTLFDTQLP